MVMKQFTRLFFCIFFLITAGVLGYAVFADTNDPLFHFTHPQDGLCHTVLFSPKGKIRETLISLIKAETRSIKVAAYVFTDKEVADALLEAKNRGIKIELVIDAGALYSTRSVALKKLRKGMPIYLYHCPDDGIMHNKFIIFERNVQHKPVLWTGSYNFSYSAQDKNRENVLIISTTLIVQAYLQEFEQLKKDAFPLMPSTKWAALCAAEKTVRP